MDRTTKFLMAAIAAGLFANAFSNLVPVARAADSLECKVSGPMEVKVTSIDDELEITWDYSAPGANSASPMYVKAVD